MKQEACYLVRCFFGCCSSVFSLGLAYSTEIERVLCFCPLSFHGKICSASPRTSCPALPRAASRPPWTCNIFSLQKTIHTLHTRTEKRWSNLWVQCLHATIQNLRWPQKKSLAHKIVCCEALNSTKSGRPGVVGNILNLGWSHWGNMLQYFRCHWKSYTCGELDHRILGLAQYNPSPWVLQRSHQSKGYEPGTLCKDSNILFIQKCPKHFVHLWASVLWFFRFLLLRFFCHSKYNMTQCTKTLSNNP